MARAQAARSRTRTYTAVLEPDEEDGGYVVTFPAIPDLATQGETIEEARAIAEDCLTACFGVLRERGQPAPPVEARAPHGLQHAIELQITVE